MSRKELQAIIRLGGRVDNTFGQIGEALTGLGYEVDVISQKLINFGKNSLIEYAQYDDLMRTTKAVGEFTDAEMEMLDALNSEIAKNKKNIFTNEELAQAEVIMGQYGMAIEEIKDMLPDTLNLAMAGNLEISDSIDYLYSSLMSLGEGVDYADELVDQMARTAAIGATDVDTLGESLTRLGSGAQLFAGGSEEIFAILTAMSKFGEDQRGSEGGTWLRNFILSLAAPTSSVEYMIDAMEQLGVAQEEIEEYASNHSSGAAAQAIESLMERGLRIYDEQGKLLPAIDIIKSLRDAAYGDGEYSSDLTQLTGILDEAGGDVDAFMESAEGLTDNALYSLLTKIFGKRGITTALNLMGISDEEWAYYTGQIVNSDGYAEAMADTLQGGLGGAQRSLNATWSEVKKQLGESLSDEAIWGTEVLNNFMVFLADIDEDTMDVLVGGLTGIAAAGPLLMTAGGAMNLLGHLLTPGGAIAGGAVILSAAAGAAIKFSEVKMSQNFGALEVDIETLRPYVQGLGADFKAAYGDIDSFSASVTSAATAYDTAATSFGSDLITLVLNHTELTEDDKSKLLGLGSDLVEQVQLGISNSRAESLSWLELVFGGAGETGVGSGEEAALERNAIFAMDGYYNALEEDAYQIGANLRDEMTKAFADGVMDGTEYKRIMDYYDELSSVMAEIEDIQNAEKLEILKHKAATVSLDNFDDYVSMVDEERNAALLSAESQYEEQRARLKVAYDRQIEWSGIDPATGWVKNSLRQNRLANGLNPDTGLAWTDEEWQKAIDNGYINYETGTWATIESRDAALGLLDNNYTEHTDTVNADYDAVLLDAFNTIIGTSALGDAWADATGYARLVREGEMDAWVAAGQLRELYGANTYAGDSPLRAFLDQNDEGQHLTEQIRSLIDQMGGWQEFQNRIIRYQEAGEYAVADAAMQTWTALNLLSNFMGNDMVYSTASDGTPYYQYVEGSGYLKWDAMNEAMQADGATDHEQYVQEWKGAEVDSPEVTVDIPDGTEDANGYISGFQGVLDANPGIWNVNVKFNTGGGLGVTWNVVGAALGGFFADGGRATEASIFGEVPGQAEWAIPEAHTQRTADLLDSAREASGFTWPELIERTGGLNANPHHTPIKVVYAPVIHAADARGVEQKLQEDKERFVKWMKEYEVEKEMASYG